MTKTTIINTVKATMLDGYTPVNKLKESTYFVKCLKVEINRVAFEGNYEITIAEEAEIVEAILSYQPSRSGYSGRKDQIMWGIGELDGYKFYMKHFENGSEYGINEGKIQKLEIRKDGSVVANYDRGWDIEPKGTEAVAIYNELIKKYN